MKQYYKRMTGIDEVIFYDKFLGNQDSQGYFESPAYSYEIADRNDYALMAALTTASLSGCRATKNRLLAGL